MPGLWLYGLQCPLEALKGDILLVLRVWNNSPASASCKCTRTQLLLLTSGWSPALIPALPILSRCASTQSVQSTAPGTTALEQA